MSVKSQESSLKNIKICFIFLVVIFPTEIATKRLGAYDFMFLYFDAKHKT